MSKTKVKSIYIGLETENVDERPTSDMRNLPQGHVEATLQISNPQLIQSAN